ncbi:MAG TPA: hypothetical protein VGA37_00305 [Gemmatimonadales bacterium]
MPLAAIEHSLFLIGDVGNPASPVEPVLAALHTAMARNAPHSTVVFLGDNIYPRGMLRVGHADRADSERRVVMQVHAVPAASRGFFIMGNHDWRRGADDGWQAVKDQEAFIISLARSSVRVAPGDGCPGPETVDLSPQLRLVLLDTQWWLHGDVKPRDPESACPTDSMGEIATAIRGTVAAAGDRHVVVVGHHPLVSGGVHGGRFDWKDHVFPLRALKRWLWIPLPIIGSLYPLVRGGGISSQDMPSSTNRRLRDSLSAAFAGIPIAYAAGHDHNLQVLHGDQAQFLLVSGAGYYGHTSKAFRTPETYFARATSGFMQIDILTDGRVRLGVLEVDQHGTAAELFSMWLTARRE